MSFFWSGSEHMHLWPVAGVVDLVAELEGALSPERGRNSRGGPVAELKLRTHHDCLPVNHWYAVVGHFVILLVLLE